MTDGWRSRIIGHGEAAPDQLLANPRNWRIHPKAQQDALTGALTEIGWIQDVIVNRRTGHVIDGHARVAIAISREEQTVPVAYVDLDENEEKIAVASFDPLAGMAVADPEALDALMAEVAVKDDALRQMLERPDAQKEWAAGGHPSQQAIEEREQALGATFQDRAAAQAKELVELTCPECGGEFSMRVRDIENVLKRQ